MRKSTRFSMAMLLTLVMWVCVPLFGWVGQAYAVNPAEGESEAPVIHVSNFDELSQQLMECAGESKTIVLDDDIQISTSASFRIREQSNVVLNLNGHKITYTSIDIGKYFFDIKNSNFSLKNGSMDSQIPCIGCNDSKIMVENVRLKGLCYSIYAINSSIEISGTNNMLEATPYQQGCTPLFMGRSLLTLSGECEILGDGRVSSAIENAFSSVCLPYNYVLTDKDGVEQNDNGYCFFAHHLYVRKNANLPEICKDGEHQLKMVPAVAATCTEYGVEAYSYCEKCKRHFTTDDVPVLLENSLPPFVAPLAHDWSKGTSCQREGCGQSMPTLKTGINSGLSLLPASFGNGMTYFSFVAPKSGHFSIRSAHNIPTLAEVCDKDFNLLATGNPYADDYGNFSLSCDMVEGDTYYVSMQILMSALFNEASVFISCDDDTFLLQDGDNIDLSAPKTYESLIYKRTFTEDEVGKWQAHIVPFEIPYEVWKDEYEVATPLNFHEYSDEDGKIIKRELEVVKVENANLPANYPLLVRVKSAGEKTFTMNQVTLKPTEIPLAGTCASMSFIYFFFPLYHTIPDEEISAGFYVNDGKLKRMEDGVSTTICAQRWYLGVQYSGGLWEGDAKPDENPFLDDSFAEIEFRLVNEDGPSTAIRDIQVVNTTINSKESSAQSGIYDLNGCRQNTLKKGINIVRQADGSVRKVMIK